MSLPRGRAFEALYNYVVVDEPAVHLMPLHFLPRSYCGAVESATLRTLGVAAKLEYARSRWIDEVVDMGRTGSTLATHRLHDTLVELVSARYAEVLRGPEASVFFPILSGLYASHAMSVAVDGSQTRRAVGPLAGPLVEEEYSAQVLARNGSFRASVDAVLLHCGAPAETLQTARESWHLWVLGAQLYDDALDAEEDFAAGSVTWTVARTLADLDDAVGDLRPDGDAFYEAALVEGALVETLVWAEDCFRSAASLAEDEFPSWAELQRACVTQTSRLRTDFQELATKIARR